MGWSDILEKWKDQQTRPKQLIQLVRKVSFTVEPSLTDTEEQWTFSSQIQYIKDDTSIQQTPFCNGQ